MGIRCPENLRVPSLGSSLEGESGLKARPKGVVDSNQVNIPGLYKLGHRGTLEALRFSEVDFLKDLYELVNNEEKRR